MCLCTEDMNDLVDRLEHPVRETDLTQELYDLPDFCISESLLNDIGRCVGVRVWIARRRETNMHGKVETHRFFAAFGIRQDVDTAAWLFDRCETTIGERTVEYVNRHAFSLNDVKLIQFQQNEVASIRKQLRGTIDYSHDAKEAVINPAFALLNIKFTRKKAHDYTPTTKAFARSITIT